MEKVRKSTSMVWPTLGSRTAKEQNRTEHRAGGSSTGSGGRLSPHSLGLGLQQTAFSSRQSAVDTCSRADRTVDSEYQWIAGRAKFDDAVARDASTYNSCLLGRLGRLNVELLVNLVYHINAMFYILPFM